jgi:type I restriction enzyme S subunit
LNTVALVGSELNGATASTGFCVLRPNKSFVEPGLLFAWVRNQLFIDELTSQAKGASYPAVTDNVVKALEIPVPPLEEQKRIVALLDAATARVAELTACYEQARTHANNLFTSALRDALESNPDWPVKTLGEVCDFVRGVTYDKADARSEMKSGYIPLLRATNITEKGLLREDFVFIPKNGVRADQKLMSGDALITIASGSVSVVGRSVLVEDPSEMTFGAFCGVLRPSPEILPRYLSHFMSSRSVRTAWSEAAQGTNINNLKRDDILQTECLLPSLSEQKRIVTRLDAMRAKTSEMVTAYDAKLTAAKNLRQSILESAFAGEL